MQTAIEANEPQICKHINYLIIHLLITYFETNSVNNNKHNMHEIYVVHGTRVHDIHTLHSTLVFETHD